MLNVAFLDRDAVPRIVDMPKLNFTHNWQEFSQTRAAELIERAQDLDIVITNKVNFTREVLAKLPRLKLIALTATGMNNVDLDAAKEFGVEVRNVAGYSFITVPEHVLAMIFALKHSIVAWDRDRVENKWENSEHFCYFSHPITDVRHSVLGIVGKGCLGQELGRLGEALGMQILYAERKGASVVRDGYTPFEEVMAKSDIISLHCTLTADTENLINAETLALCSKKPIFINTGRGGLVDEDALYQALLSGQISAAGLDVLKQEPPSKDNVLIKAAKTMPNLIITPHIAWASNSAVELLLGKVRDNIETFVANLNK